MDTDILDPGEQPLDPPANPVTSPQVVPLRARQWRVPQTFSALRHRNFQLYFGGQLVSVAGTWMQIIAQGWLVYEISHSERMLGIVGFAAAIPALLVSPWGGVLVDRVPKRNLIVATQSISMLLAFGLAALTFSGQVQVWHVIALSAVLGGVNAIDSAARQAFVVDMVGRDDLTNAIAVNSIMYNLARILGPALGGFLLASVGSAWCFFINGLTFLAVIAGLLAMRVRPHQFQPRTASPWKDLIRGLQYVFQHTEQFALLLVAMIFAVFGLSYATLLPAFADRVLHAGAAGFGAMNAVTGVGAIVGALMIAGRPAHRGRWLVASSMAFPIILLAFAYTPWYSLSLVLSAGLGLTFMVQYTLLNTLLQLQVADAMRGRVMSLYMLTFFGLTPFGNLALGILAEVWGLSLAIGLGAIVAAVLTAVVVFLVPRVAKMA